MMHFAAGLESRGISPHEMREWAAKIHDLLPERRAWLASEIVAMTRRFEAVCREASDAAHQANVLRAELVKLRQQLNETLAAGGASPSAPPAGPSAGGGD